MPVVASCPSCGAPLSETSVLALAPVCQSCRAVITSVGGTLGLIGAYGVNDPTLTRRRVQADLAVLREDLVKYRGMTEACLQKLHWGVERYAKLPQPPELLALKDVPSFWEGLLRGLGYAAIWFVVSYVAAWIFVLVYSFFNAFTHWRGTVPPFSHNRNTWIEHIDFFYQAGFGWLEPENFMLNLLVYGGCVVFVCALLFPHFKVRVANGKRPLENARRQEAHKEAVAAALKAAEPLKAAEDHRLRTQVRELEGLAKTVGEKEAEVCRLLTTL